MQREQHWVVDGICQVCMGNQFDHFISSEAGVYWCNAAELVELGLEIKGEK